MKKTLHSFSRQSRSDRIFDVVNGLLLALILLTIVYLSLIHI